MSNTSDESEMEEEKAYYELIEEMPKACRPHILFVDVDVKHTALIFRKLSQIKIIGCTIDGTEDSALIGRKNKENYYCTF